MREIHFCWTQKNDIFLLVCCMNTLSAQNYLSVDFGLLGFVVG
jgi:hypothetical protein